MFIFLIVVIAIALFIQLIQKYVLKIEEPKAEDFWVELDKQEWFMSLNKNVKYQKVITNMKETGILKDAHYCKQLLDHEGYREGFIIYLKERVIDTD